MATRTTRSNGWCPPPLAACAAVVLARAAVILTLSVACQPPNQSDDETAGADLCASCSPSPSSPVVAGEGQPPRLDLVSSSLASSEHFATAAACSGCHTNAEGAQAMRDAAGRPVAPFDLWRASMMANAARDPFWWAAVSYEAEPWPRVELDIESGCTVCHAPSLAAESKLSGGALPTLETLRGADAVAQLGLDGVTCSVCHQIEAEGLGTSTTFNGAFVTATAHPAYGPYPDPVLGPMESSSGYLPTHGPQLGDAGLCASCHMVENATLGITGEPSNRRVDEQTVYLEWQASSFDTADGATPRTCQSCHAPIVDEDGAPLLTAIASGPDGADDPRYLPRAPYGRHSFLGGNAYVLSLFRDNAAELAPDVPSAAFESEVQATRVFLRTAARISVGAATRSGDLLEVPVLVENLTGHKLPTGFPSRRMWLDVTVTNVTGAVVFRSGATDEDGRLLNDTGTPLTPERVKGPNHPHRNTLEGGQVQVWEVVMQEGGLPIYRVLEATGVGKDDRILPTGWDGLDTSLAPVGIGSDDSFSAGSDTVTLRIEAPVKDGPYTASVDLRYQSIGTRHLDEVLEGDGEPVLVFGRMVRASDRTPDTLAGVRVVLE